MDGEDLINAIMANQRSRRLNNEPDPSFRASLAAAELMVIRVMLPGDAAALQLRHGDTIIIHNCHVMIDHRLEGITLRLR